MVSQVDSTTRMHGGTSERGHTIASYPSVSVKRMCLSPFSFTVSLVFISDFYIGTAGGQVGQFIEISIFIKGLVV